MRSIVALILALLGSIPSTAQTVNRVSSVLPTNYPCAASITMTVIGPGALGQVHQVCQVATDAMQWCCESGEVAMTCTSYLLSQGFGNLPSNLKVRIQGSACDVTEWLSASSTLCKTSTAGFDTSNTMYVGQIVLTMQTNVQFTLVQSFSFDLPAVSGILNANGPTVCPHAPVYTPRTCLRGRCGAILTTRHWRVACRLPSTSDALHSTRTSTIV